MIQLGASHVKQQRNRGSLKMKLATGFLALSVLTGLAVGLSACATAPGFNEKAPPRQLILEKDLVGRVLGEGQFINTLTGDETNFSVEINGTWSGKSLTLVEDFSFQDGTKERKTWVLDKLAEGKYAGTREDVLGTADVTQDGLGVRLDYYVTLTTGLGGIDVRFRDLLSLNDDGTIDNKAVVSKFGLRIGRVNITMRPQRKSN